VTGTDRVAYRFGPLERRGLLGGIRPGQALSLAAGGVIAVTTLDSWPSASGALGGLAAVAVAVALAALRVGGRGVTEWLPIVCAHLLKRISARHVVRSPVARRGMLWRGRSGDAVIPPRPAPPPAVADVTIIDADHRGRGIGILSERGGRRLTAVLACRVVSFALLDPEAQERRLARWGLVLSSAAALPIRRIQWLERTAPAQGDELARWLSGARDPSIPLRGAPIVESYLELITTTTRVTQAHEVLIAIQSDGGSIRERRAGTARVALMDSTERVARALEAAEISVLGVLNPGQLGRVLRTAFDPFSASELATLGAVDRNGGSVAEANAWPLGAREAWDHYVTDGAQHATYWIGGWPRVDVSPMFMDAILGHSNVVRTVSVTFEPIAPERSTREVEAAVTRDRADRELRHRFGQSETARQRQAQEAALRREGELAAGHGEVRLSGFVTVSGRSETELRSATSQVLEQAARARLELHRMYGQQADAFTFTLPLCRGLR
jgi:hypothetical protein